VGLEPLAVHLELPEEELTLLAPDDQLAVLLEVDVLQHRDLLVHQLLVCAMTRHTTHDQPHTRV
jgi:hypothetical protein